MGSVWEVSMCACVWSVCVEYVHMCVCVEGERELLVTYLLDV